MAIIFEPSDIIVDLAARHAPYEIAVFFIQQFHRDGHPSWIDGDHAATKYWSFKSESTLNKSIITAGLIKHTDYTVSDKQRTLVEYKSGTSRVIEHMPVVFFKDRATLVRLKLYM